MNRLLSLLLVISVFAAACTNDESRPQPAPSAAPANAPSIQELSVQELGQFRQQHPQAVILDVRTPEEFAASHIPGAVNMDVNAQDFDEKIASLDKSKPHVVYCRTGRRSTTAAEKLIANNVPTHHLSGGMTEWQKANLPTTRP